MSDAGTPRKWRFYVRDMLVAAEKVRAYIGTMSQVKFAADSLVYDAVLRNLALVGEAASHIPEAVRAEHPEIPWRRAVATRNRLIHGYLGIDDDIIWNIVCEDIPALIPKLRTITEESQE